MSVVVGLILASLCLAVGFLTAFTWAVRTGQFDDTGTPPLRLLADDADEPAPVAPISNKNRTP